MARRVEPADSLDYFPTPPWATRAACRHALPLVWPWPDLFTGTAWDPACGEGHMALALADHFADVTASDIHPYGFGTVQDFLHPDMDAPSADWIISNPPFNLGAEFIATALKLARRGVAMLVRLAFLESEGRFTGLFARRPPQLIAQFVERVPMHKGRWVVNGKSATAYAWLVWRKHVPHDFRLPGFAWIPPCRAALTRPDDWLRFSGCIDIPAAHPSQRASPAPAEPMEMLL